MYLAAQRMNWRTLKAKMECNLFILVFFVKQK